LKEAILKKWLLVISYAITILIILLNKEQLVTWIQQKDSTNILAMLIIAILLALFPVVPYGLVAGAIGAKVGFLIGGVINIVASTCAAILMFVVFRYAFAGAARRMIKKNQRIDRFTQLFEANAFGAVLLARLIPIIPAQLVNIYSAISRINFITFTIATMLGKIPVMVTFAIVGDQLFTNKGIAFITITIYAVFLLLIYLSFRVWRRYKYAELDKE
jgi:uncharacterized membrane protein YdjX (TVP38/TMEM64 family)